MGSRYRRRLTEPACVPLERWLCGHTGRTGESLARCVGVENCVAANDVCGGETVRPRPQAHTRRDATWVGGAAMTQRVEHESENCRVMQHPGVMDGTRTHVL